MQLVSTDAVIGMRKLHVLCSVIRCVLITLMKLQSLPVTNVQSESWWPSCLVSLLSVLLKSESLLSHKFILPITAEGQLCYP
jgi:hypothetical protein